MQLQENWYKEMIDDCKQIIVEGVFNSNWYLIETYHNVGLRILKEYPNFERAKIYGQKITTGVAESLGKSTRTIERAIQFAKLYPDLNALPEGKNTNWHRIINKYLTKPGEKQDKFIICPNCGFENQKSSSANDYKSAEGGIASAQAKETGGHIGIPRKTIAAL